MGERPVIAFALGLIAGLLMLLAGVLLSTAGGILVDLGGASAGASLMTEGTLGILFGALVVLLSIVLVVRPNAHRELGVAILLLSALDVVGGAGFILGVILGLIAGGLAVYFDAAGDFDEGEFPPAPLTPGRRCSRCGCPALHGEKICTSCSMPIVAA